MYLVHRREEFRASPIMADRARANEKIEFVLNKVVVEVLGEPSVVAVRLEDTITGEQSMLETDGLFVAIGHDEHRALPRPARPRAGDGVPRDTRQVDGDEHRGRLRRRRRPDHVYRQAVTAAGSGCAAALDAERWLSEQRPRWAPSPARGKADAGVTLARESMRRLDLIDPSRHELLSRVPARLDPDALEMLSTPAETAARRDRRSSPTGRTCSPSCSSPARSAPTTESSITARRDRVARALVTVRKRASDGDVADLSVLDGGATSGAGSS